jgi:hypothetical protein
VIGLNYNFFVLRFNYNFSVMVFNGNFLVVFNLGRKLFWLVNMLVVDMDVSNFNRLGYAVRFRNVISFMMIMNGRSLLGGS